MEFISQHNAIQLNLIDVNKRIHESLRSLVALFKNNFE